MTFVWGLLGRERKRFGLQRVIQRNNLQLRQTRDMRTYKPQPT